MVFVFEIGQVKIVHLGDAGLIPEPEVRAAIAHADAILVNVDGYVLPLDRLLPEMERLGARTIVPTHFSVLASARWATAETLTLEEYLDSLPPGVVVARMGSEIQVTPGMPRQVAGLPYLLLDEQAAEMSVFIQTARLILRTVTMEDIEDVAHSWKLDQAPLSRQEAQERIAWMLDNHRQNAPGRLTHLCLAIICKENRAFIGWCGLDHRDKTKAHPVLFYLLKANYWGQGLATEAAGAVLGYAFRELGLAQVDGGAGAENLASKRVMEKIGMRYVGLDEEGGHSFTLTREEYSQAKKG